MNIINNLKLLKRALQLSVFIRHIYFYIKNIEFGTDDSGHPNLKYRDKILTGIKTKGQELKTFNSIKKILPNELPESHYRLMRDFITRYVYPHMMPNETVNAIYPKFILSGFHGQHSDAICHIKDKEKRETLKEKFTIKHDDVIINGGAFMGFGDVRISEINHNGKIIAVEASKECFDILNHNLKINRVKNVFPIHAAIWNKQGKMSLNTSEFQANSLLNTDVKDRNKAVILNVENSEFVNTLTIDQIVKIYELEKVDFVSLTLNGAEPEALDGMNETLINYKPRIRLAGYYFRNKPIWEICSEKLKQYDYEVVIGQKGSFYAYSK